MIRTIAIALAAASALTAGAADARAHCTCSTAKHHAHHRHHARTMHSSRTTRTTSVIVTPVVPTTTKAVVESETYIAPETAYLPDPNRPGRTPWIAQADELRIAADLNESLDIWRTCGWSNYEQPAAAFNAWARTHVDKGPNGSGVMVASWKPLADASFARTTALTDPIERSKYCLKIRDDRTDLRAKMDVQMYALAQAHAAAHKH